MQRMIAEQLKLPDSVMELFAAQDEKDDYQNIGKGSRTEIRRVAEVIHQEIQKVHRFLLIFHNGSSEEIDLSSLGFPLFDQYSRSKVLWSFQGRFRLYPKTKVDRALKSTRSTTNLFLSAAVSRSDIGKLMSDILPHEADEVARQMVNIYSIDWSAAATSYFLYVMKLRSMGNHITDYDHALNYWRCDGMIQLQQQGDVGTDRVDKLWQSSDALHHEIQLDEDYYQYFSSPVERHLHAHMACWTSPTYGVMLIQDPHAKIPKGTFQQFDKLCVLKLSACTFSFTSPPFLCCHNLKFLWIDRCKDGSRANEEVKEEDINQFLQRLWVLDVRHSNNAFLSKEMMDFMTQLRELNVLGDKKLWHVNLVQSQLHNIHKLRIKESTVGSPFLFSGMDKMELLELSRNYTIDVRSKIYVKSCRSLETIIINGFDDLISIFLSGCAKLKKILLSGSFERLNKIRIIGAGIETLDLSAVTTLVLNELCLLDCEKLCAILWPPASEDREKIYLDKLRIDTTLKEGTTEHTAGEAPGDFDWHISVRDARILQSLESVKDYFSSNPTHVEISSPSDHPCANDDVSKDDRMESSSGQHVQENQKQLIMDIATYADVSATFKDINKQHKQDNEGDTDALAIKICPPPPYVPSQGCYIHIEDRPSAKLQVAITAMPAFICDSAKILHVHDSLHITSIVAAPLASATWNQLEWCRVERCPRLGNVFSPEFDEGLERSNNNENFKDLRKLWASNLPKARHIWKWNGSSISWYFGRTFENVAFLHIDYCPRLINIIHLPVMRLALDKLETLEIMWCGNLSVAFHFYDTSGMYVSEFGRWGFNKLKHIRLHELPKLQNICNIGFNQVAMPELKTIKIRGCWNLRRLPIFRSNNVVKCDCEKEWWDRLEWESAEHASKYKPTYPRHYKKTMLKGSVLR